MNSHSLIGGRESDPWVKINRSLSSLFKQLYFVNTPLLAHKPSRKSCYLFHVSIFNWCHII